MFQAFGFALLVLGALYAFLMLNNRRAAHRSSPPQTSGQQTVPATFVMQTVDIHNSTNHDDLLVFTLDDGAQLTFSVAKAKTAGWPAGVRGMLTYALRSGAPEWISFVPDAPAAAEETAPATVVRLYAADSAALFELSDGSRVRLNVPPVALPLLREGLSGSLTWQDKTFILFTPAS